MSPLKLTLLILFFASVASHRAGETHSCSHDKRTLSFTFVDVPVATDHGAATVSAPASAPDGGNSDRQPLNNENETDKPNRSLQQSYPSLRVYPIFDTLTAGSDEFKDYLKTELVPSVVNFLQRLLKVKYPVTGNISVQPASTSTSTSTSTSASYANNTCGVPTPSILYSGVTGADLVLLITAFNDTSTTVAEASHCMLHSVYFRPIISVVSFNLNAVVYPNGDALIHENNVQATLHEVTHGLGFSSGLFPYFVDVNGKQRTGHMITQTINGVTAKILNVEPLTSKLRAHFNCSALAGAVMENQGGAGSAASHFERRLFGYEYMTSSLLSDMRISEFTLALLEGSGWYVPDYTMAEPSYWGKGQGCSFVNGSCMTKGKPNFDEFCKTGTFGCSPTGREAVNCGPDSFSDGCSWYGSYSYLDCEDPTSVDYAALPSMEMYGSGTGSRCFTGNLYKGYSSSGQYGYCFKFNCQGTGTSTTLNVQIGNTTVTCKAAGSISVSGLTGKLNCPDPVEYCSTIGQAFCKRGCMGNGKCVNGQCQCASGWRGLDCGDQV